MLYKFVLPNGFHLQLCQMAFTYENERSHEIMTYVFENIHILLSDGVKRLKVCKVINFGEMGQ